MLADDGVTFIHGWIIDGKDAGDSNEGNGFRKQMCGYRRQAFVLFHEIIHQAKAN